MVRIDLKIQTFLINIVIVLTNNNNKKGKNSKRTI